MNKTEFTGHMNTLSGDGNFSTIAQRRRTFEARAYNLRARNLVALCTVFAAIAVLSVVLALFGKLDGFIDIAGKHFDETTDDEAFEYEINEDGTAVITAFNDENAYYVNIPRTLNGVDVSKIGDDAFRCLPKLRSVKIPEGVAEIGTCAFLQCQNLKTVVLPESLTVIKDYAFNSCTSLRNIDIPNGVVEIGEGAFNSCKALKSVVIPAGVIQIRDYTFDDCSSLSKVVISEGVREIGCSAFEHCKNLKSIVIPEGVKEIGRYAFSDCTALARIAIPESVVSIDYYSFSDTPWLTRQKQEFLIVGDGILLDYNGKGGFVVIPDEVKQIVGAFYHRTDVTGVYIPDGVMLIGECSFMYCSKLESVRIPQSVMAIGGNAFSKCSGLKKVVMDSGVKVILINAFSECTGLESINLPDSITRIEYGAFNNCRSLKEIKLPEGLTEISKKTFYFCLSLRKVTFPDSLKIIGDEAFAYSNLSAATTVPDGVESIGFEAFLGTDIFPQYPKVEFFTIGDGFLMHYKGDGGSVTLPDTVKHICMEFADNDITELDMGANVVSIGKKAFYGCKELKKLTIPAGVTYIGEGAFGSSSLTEITFGGTRAEWDALGATTSDDVEIICLGGDGQPVSEKTAEPVIRQITQTGVTKLPAALTAPYTLSNAFTRFPQRFIYRIAFAVHRLP